MGASVGGPSPGADVAATGPVAVAYAAVEARARGADDVVQHLAALRPHVLLRDCAEALAPGLLAAACADAAATAQAQLVLVTDAVTQHVARLRAAGQAYARAERSATATSASGAADVGATGVRGGS